MNTYKLELTEIEIACGVTLEQVQQVLPKALVRSYKVVLPSDSSPALAAATARCALAAPAEYVGMFNGCPVYQAT